jgi:CDP-diacylglycerol--glycerol-3-phosphate 3-phosphatidyltransferase
MFSKAFNERIRQMTGLFVSKTLARTPVTASELTVLSPILTLVAVWFLATGNFFFGGLIVAFASTFDMLDGALARAKNNVTKFGSFLDSTLDRYSEVLIFFGLLLYYERVPHETVSVILIYVAAVGSLLVSYIRARAEALGYDCKVGLLERPERIILLVLGLLTGWVTLVLWILAVFTHVTALQRFVYVWTQSREKKVKERTKSSAL